MPSAAGSLWMSRFVAGLCRPSCDPASSLVAISLDSLVIRMVQCFFIARHHCEPSSYMSTPCVWNRFPVWWADSGIRSPKFRS